MTVSKPETVEANQADRDLVFSLMSPAARNEIEKLALEYIRDGRGDDAEAVQAVARHRLNATPSRQDGLREAREALQMAADWFRDYERQHRAKATEDGDRKAETNGERANFLENTLAALSDTPPPAELVQKMHVLDNEETEALRGENERLKAENERLTRAVGSGILNDLLTPDESDEFVKFIQFLRGQRDASAFNNGGK